MNFHQAKIVEELRTFYGEDDLINMKKLFYMKEYLAVLASRMYEGVQHQKSFIFQEINNYHKDYLGRPIPELQQLNWTLSDCQHAIANEYGFENWDAIDNEIEYDAAFEFAVEALLKGRFEMLKNALDDEPDLIHRKSRFGHEATLLHYVASNGVEFWRQIVPHNLPEMTRYLIEKGADKNAKMKVYGGEFSVLPLLETSAHPYKAGIANEMIEILT